MQLDDKVFVITGSGDGIGRATAVEAARRGARIVVSDIDDAAGQETLRQVEAAGGEGIYVHADMRSRADIRALMEAAAGQFGRIDVLHNNAGVHETNFTTETATQDLSEDVWDTILAINLTAVWLCAKHALPHMRTAGGGAIVNAASVGGLIAYPMSPAYAATKAAVINLTKAMALDFWPDKVRANAICPAAVETAMTSRYWEAADDKEAIKKALIGSHLVRRLGDVRDVANLVCFLASEEAAFINGTAVLIDGGSLAWRGTIME